jgi:threonine synthase
MVALGTAHPAKFGDAVSKATGIRAPLPAHLADLMDRKEHFTVLPNDQSAIEAFVRKHARAAKGGA